MTPDPKPEPVSREEIKRQREADERERQRQADHGISAKAICGTEPFPGSIDAARKREMYSDLGRL
jgi:hypothetical protein